MGFQLHGMPSDQDWIGFSSSAAPPAADMTLTYLRMGADAAEELEAAKDTGACLDHHAHDKPYSRFR